MSFSSKCLLKITLVLIFAIKLAYASQSQTMWIYNSAGVDISYQQTKSHDFTWNGPYSGMIESNSANLPTQITLNDGNTNRMHPINTFTFGVGGEDLLYISLKAPRIIMYSSGCPWCIHHKWAYPVTSIANYASNTTVAVSLLMSHGPGNNNFYFYLYDSGHEPASSVLTAICAGCNWVKVQPPINMIGYYPAGCIGSQCKCVQDLVSGDIWQVNGEKYSGQWSDWCSADPQNPGYDPNCASAISGGSANGASGGKLLANANSVGICGLNDNRWHLPTASSNIAVNTAITTYKNFNIGHLVAVALNNGYIPNNNLALWMNNNGFTNVNASPISGPYWLSSSDGNSNAFVLNMNNGSITNGSQEGLNYGVMLVHENK